MGIGRDGWSGGVALVTGAGHRIGAALALALAEAGVAVAVHYRRSAEDANRLCARMRAMGGVALAVAADLEDPREVVGLLATTRRKLGPVRLLVNNAAIFEPGGLREASLDQWRRHLAINLTAPWLLMQAFANQEELRSDVDERQEVWSQAGEVRGQIVNLLDQRILRPRPGHAAYTTAKSGLWALTQMAAVELAPRIRVNGLALGPILPAVGEERGVSSEDGPSDSPPDRSFSRVASATPMGRPGSVEDVVQAMFFLLDNDYVTGQLLCVDGGEHLR